MYAHLPPLQNREEVFGSQFVVDETGDLIRKNQRLLLTSTGLSTEQVVDGVRDLGGLCIAAHVDRQAFSLLANLGFIPPGLPLVALEVSPRTQPAELAARHGGLSDWPWVISGDAHRLSDMRASTHMTVVEPTVREMELAFRGEDGRKVVLRP